MNDERLETRPVHRSSFIARRLISALWFGSAIFAIVAAAAAFRAAGSPTEAANVVGAMLVRWHYIALLAPLAMMILEWRRARARVQVVLFAAIILASLEALADTRIRIMRMESPVSISSLSPRDPVRRRFGILHGLSSMLLLVQAVAAAAVVVMSDGERE